MKTNLLILSKLTLISLFVVGCGGSGSSNTKTDTTEYDLSQYLVPATSQTNIYEEFTYDKADGENEFTQTDKSYSNEKYDVNGSNITITIDNELTETVVIGTDKIIRTFVDEEEGNETMISERTAMIGDTVIETTQTRAGDAVDLEIELVCKLSKHLDEKELDGQTYEDVMLVECTQELIEESITLNGVEITVDGSGVVNSYFAKDIGLISYEEEACSNTTIVTNTTTVCYKELSTLITIVE